MKYVKILFVMTIFLISVKSFCAAADLKQVNEKNKSNLAQFLVSLGDKIVLDDNKIILEVHFKDQGNVYFDMKSFVHVFKAEVLRANTGLDYIGFNLSFSIERIKFDSGFLKHNIYGKKLIINFPFTDKEGEIKTPNVINHLINKMAIPAVGLFIEDI